jgi:hypothetical protein
MVINEHPAEQAETEQPLASKQCTPFLVSRADGRSADSQDGTSGAPSRDKRTGGE